MFFLLHFSLLITIIIKEYYTTLAAMSAVENWGQLKLSSGVKQEEGGLALATLDLLPLDKGKGRVNDSDSTPLISIPVQSVTNASGTTKNDISLSLKQHSSVGKVKGTEVELVSVRFAVPNTCVGYEQTEEAGKVVLQEIQDAIKGCHADILGDEKSDSGILRLATMASGEEHKDEKIICVFDDINLSSPAGKYKFIVSNYHVVLQEKKKGSLAVISFPLTDILHLYLCDIPSYFSKTNQGDYEDPAQYVVLVLKKPIKVRSTSYAHVVISCPPSLKLDDEHPWKCEVDSQEEINELLQFSPADNDAEPPLKPVMSGRVSEIILRALKGIAKVPAYGGVHKEYRTVLTQQVYSCMRALYRSSEGLLYVVNGGLLFLYRPAVKLSFSDITHVEVDESETGVATFQLSVYAHGEKYVFSAIDKEEKEGFLKFLGKVTKLVRHGMQSDEDKDDDEEEEEEEEDSEPESSDEEEDGEAKHSKKEHKKSHKKHKHKRSHDHKHHKHKKHRTEK